MHLPKHMKYIEYHSIYMILATIFHSYWSKGNENNDYKFIQNEKIRNLNVLAILKLVNLVIKMEWVY